MLPLHDILHRTGLAFGLAALLGLTAGCHEYIGPEPSPQPGDVYMSAAVSIRGVAGTINTSADFEDRVKTVRLIICDTNSGAVLYNQVHPVGDFTGQPEGQTTVWSKPFKITEGQRDFFFIANEHDWNLDVPLASVVNRSQLFADNALTHIAFPAGYRPSEAKPMLMTRVYRNVTVVAVRNGKGSSQTDPQHFEADGDEQVELIRTLAKVKLTLKGVVNVDDVAGTPTPTDIKFKRVTPFKGMTLVNVPKYFSLFVNPYFDGAGYPSTGQFSTDFYNATELAETNGFTKAQMLANSEAHYLAPSEQPGQPTTLYDYVTSYYVPEYLRRVGTNDPAPASCPDPPPSISPTAATTTTTSSRFGKVPSPKTSRKSKPAPTSAYPTRRTTPSSPPCATTCTKSPQKRVSNSRSIIILRTGARAASAASMPAIAST